MAAPAMCLCMEVKSCARIVKKVNGMGGVFPCGKEMHPIHSAMFTLGCLTHSESNLISITCFKSHLNIQYILSTYNKNEFLLNVTVVYSVLLVSS